MRTTKEHSANIRQLKQNKTHLSRCVFCLRLQLICKSQFAKTQEYMSPFLTCFPLLPTAEPYGQGHTHRAHIKRRRFIMPLVALVQKNRAHQRLRTNTGAWGSLSRRRCSSRSVFEGVSACLRTLFRALHRFIAFLYNYKERAVTYAKYATTPVGFSFSSSI